MSPNRRAGPTHSRLAPGGGFDTEYRMAATDTTLHNVKTLHVVFAVTSILMLVTIVGMFADDYYREWKVEQRIFRDVEQEMAKRGVLAAAPSEAKVKEISAVETDLMNKKNSLAQAKADFEKQNGELLSRKLKKETELAGVKAEYDSLMSFINEAAQQSDEGLRSSESQKLRGKLDKANEQMSALKLEVEKNQTEYDTEAQKVGIPDLEKAVADADKKYKELLADFDRFIKLAAQKRWTWKDTLRALPILEGFASPTKIQQYTLNELPIDYSFKYVTRYDRCTTCHLGLEKASFDKATLASLAEDPGLNKDLATRFAGAKSILEKRRADGVPDLPRPEDIRPRMIDKSRLTDARVSQFCAHNRLDLFVDANSPHPAEKFGCTICHSGQGSGTAFFDASHYPNDATVRDRWAKEYGWRSNHDWEMPMLPHRFIESSCLKCHHDVTDLIRDGNRVEAPKLVKGYNLVRELGCFGCHEISGVKSGKQVGPDLRLETDPPLEQMSPADRMKALADPLNPPGTQRKVGPSLNRLVEKTNEDWVKAWIKAPRGFRPDTKMPHFYMQANNSPEALAGTGQEKFPDAEINAIAYYLLTKSKQQVDELTKYHTETAAARQADAAAIEADKTKVTDAEKKLADPKLKDADKPKLEAELKRFQQELSAAEAKVKHRDEILANAPPVSLLKLPAAGNAERGRVYFQEKGCMACHRHSGTGTNGEPVDDKKVPAMLGEAQFGPDLSRVALKIAPAGGDAESGRRWLISWLLNPSGHSPRTLMPSVQLTTAEANDLAAWLLGQKPEWNDKVTVEPADRQTLHDMAKIYLEKVFTRSETRILLDNGITDDRLRSLAPDADERELSAPLDDNKLKLYVGKKAIGNMGCYGCHTIPGFQNAKPIGTALNDWGKKDPARIAYEDSQKFVQQHFNVVSRRDDAKDPSKPSSEWHTVIRPDGKVLKPYEEYFADMLDHHHLTREGFLSLKLTEPRSYDYNRIKSWEDRLRMPQFKFSRAEPFAKKRAAESDKAYYDRLRAELQRYGVSAPAVEEPAEEQTAELEKKLAPFDESRLLKDEADSREAVMTFVLGLLAEPIPSQYVHRPTGDKAAEVAGRKVLDKFNCAGCHIVRPGSIDFKPVDFKRFEGHPNVRKQEEPYIGDDYVYPQSIAWSGRDPANYDKLTTHGVTPPIEVKFGEEEEANPDARVWLMQAFRFRQDGKKEGKVRDIPAGATLFIPPNWILSPQRGDPNNFTSPQYGGAFTHLVSQYLQRKDRENFGGQAKMSNAYAAAPPVLIGEGEKVQPEWLIRFLLNPYPIRPLTVLRMPKFNMSPEEAQTLAHYFASVDKTQDVGIGLTYPYVPMPQRDENYVRRKTEEYIARLKAENQFEAHKKDLQSFWEKQLVAEQTDAEKKWQEAKERLRAAPEAAKAEAQKQVDDAKALVDKLDARAKKKDLSEFVKQWEEREAYFADAARLVGHGNVCLTCHHAAGLEGKENKGPNLDNVAERLRPDWMQRWITNPSRFLHYSSVMPINFKATARENQDAFLGSSMDQIQAARDFLLMYPQIRDWPVLRARPILGLTPTTPATGAK